MSGARQDRTVDYHMPWSITLQTTLELDIDLMPLDPCIGVDCAACKVCNKTEGETPGEPMGAECVIDWSKNGTECDDGLYTTYPDVCVDGQCKGRRNRQIHYRFIPILNQNRPKYDMTFS